MAKLPDDIQDIVNRKQEYIDANRNRLESNVIKMQEALLNRFIEEILPALEVKDGSILNTAKNMRLIEKLDELYKSFNLTTQTKVVKELGESLLNLNKLNANYFKKITSGEVLKPRFDSVTNKTNELMGARIGVSKDGKISKGSYLDSFLTDNALLTELKQSVISNVTGQQTIEKFRKDIKDKIVGNKQVTGGFEKYYRQFAYDTYQQYDRAYGKNMAIEFGMDYAIYQGGLIDDSRDFCRDHQSKVYTKEEIKQFGKWTYEKAQNITEFEDPGDHKGVPSYIAKFPNYDPETCLGGFNCRHGLTWVTKSYAERLRPDLKTKAEKPTEKTLDEIKPSLSEKEVIKLEEVKENDYLEFEIDKMEYGNNIMPVYNEKYDRVYNFYKEQASKVKINKDEQYSINAYKAENEFYYENNGDYTAIRDYLTDKNKFIEINNSKRKEYQIDVDVIDNRIKNISNSIDNNIINENIILKRNVTSNNFFDKLEIGDSYIDKSFISASLVKQSGFGDLSINILCKKGSKVACLGSSMELEFIIQKEQQYKVIDKKDNQLTVELL